MEANCEPLTRECHVLRFVVQAEIRIENRVLSTAALIFSLECLGYLSLAQVTPPTLTSALSYKECSRIHRLMKNQ